MEEWRAASTVSPDGTSGSCRIIDSNRPTNTGLSMIIEFTRTGGCAGTTLAVTVDTETLNDAEAEKLITLVSLIRPERLRSGVDRFSYVVKVTNKTPDGDRSNTFRFGEQSHPELVAYLSDKAKMVTKSH